MKSYFRKCFIFCLFLGLILLTISCKNKHDKVTLVTTEVSGITQTSAISGGIITAGKNISVTSRGVCWGFEETPGFTNDITFDGNGTGDFVSALSGLKPGTTYYVRAYAITRSDTIFGSNVIFTTQNYGTLTDIEGNEYKILTIGTQIWMAENLATTRYSDGSAIPLVTSDVVWADLKKPAYCWYKNDETAFKPEYGALYNWFTVKTGKLCPIGWHVPGDEEWTTLTDFLGGEAEAGGKMKERGTTFWVEPNTGATNTYGFSAFPGGFRYYDGKFFDFGFSGYWWSATEYIPSVVWFRFLYYNESTVFRFNNQARNGFSIRCLKN
jgi:uncharacterized protein (TIGR02145 family)